MDGYGNTFTVTFTATQLATVSIGDANQDGEIDAVDAHAVLVYYTEEIVDKEYTLCDDLELEVRIVVAMDIDQDGDLDADDAYLILAILCTGFCRV